MRQKKRPQPGPGAKKDQRIVRPGTMHLGFRWGEVACGDDAPLLPISRTVADAAISAAESRDGCFSAGCQSPGRDEESDRAGATPARW